MDQQVIALHSEYVLRIIVATLCGLVIGYERENRNKEAGIRTHAIVAMGAALVMIVSKYGFGDVASYDGSRVAAQIVSGVGFLGAGIIFVRNNSVSGLTTAAGIWTTSGIGMAMGAGLYVIGAAATVMIVLIQFILHKRFILNRAHKVDSIEFSADRKELDIKAMQDMLEREKIEVVDMEVFKEEGSRYRIILEVSLPYGYGRPELIKMFMGWNFVHSLKC